VIGRRRSHALTNDNSKARMTGLGNENGGGRGRGWMGSLMHHLLCAQRSPSRPQDSYTVLSGFPAGRTSTSHGAADWRSCPAPFPGDQQPGGSGERRFGSAPSVANGCAWHRCSKSYSRNERNTELCANCNEASLVVNGFDYITLPVAHALVSHTAHTQEEAAEAATAGGDGREPTSTLLTGPPAPSIGRSKRCRGGRSAF
jgi:hypothetical protein